MSLTVTYYPDASAYLDAAVEWYGTVSNELVDRFLAEAEKAIEGIIFWPDAAPLESSWTGQPPIRCARVKGFPYRLVYMVVGEIVWVPAVAHDKRKPGYWLER